MIKSRENIADNQAINAEGKPSLLVELLCEELPPKQLFQLSHEFGAELCAGLKAAGLLDNKHDYNKIKQEHLSAYEGDDFATKNIERWGFVSYNTCRRLAFLIQGVRKKAPEKKQVRRGPAKSNAYTGSEPSKALSGFLRANNASKKDLIEIEVGDKTYVALEHKTQSLALDALIGNIIEDAIKKTVAPKMMRWGDNDWKFVRPIRNFCVVHGNRSVKADVFNMTTRGSTVGHRFLHPKEFDLSQNGGADGYVTAMEKRKVLVNPWERWERITVGLKKIEKSFNDAGNGNKMIRIQMPNFESDDNIRMTEWSQAASFGLTDDLSKKIINDIPYKIAKACIEKHICGYCIMSGDKKRPLLPQFAVVVDNKFKTKLKEDVKTDKLITGFGMVFRSRLDDADFIYKLDIRTFEELQDKLKNTAYLPYVDGNLSDRSERLKGFAEKFAKSLAPKDRSVRKLAIDAAEWCQIDLVSHTLEEYPQLAGYVAANLLRERGESSEAVWDLLASWKNETIEKNNPALHSLILADEIERLVLFASLSRLPSGSSDPYGLRSSATRVLSVLSDYKGRNLSEFVRSAEKIIYKMTSAVKEKDGKIYVSTKVEKPEKAMDKLVKFIFGRLVHLMHESGDDDLGTVTPRMCQAVTAGLKYGDEIDLHAIFERTAALSILMEKHDAQLRQAMVLHKRLYNITQKKNLAENDDENFNVDKGKLKLDAEKNLHNVIFKIKIDNDRKKIVNVVEKDFLTKLLPLVEDFFDKVRIDVDDKELAQNRLALVNMAKSKFDSVADFRRLYS